MKIRIPSPYNKDRDETITQYASRCLDGSAHDSGQLEALARSTDNCAVSFGRLLEMLATKKVLTAPEIARIVEGYEDPEATLL